MQGYNQTCFLELKSVINTKVYIYYPWSNLVKFLLNNIHLRNAVEFAGARKLLYTKLDR